MTRTALHASEFAPSRLSGSFPGLAGAASCELERWLSACGAPPRLDLARSGAPGLTTRDVLGCARPADLDAYLDLPLDYGAGAGTERLRRAIGNVVGASPGDVLVTHGAIEGLLLACAASVDRRPAVAVASPGYEGLFRTVEAAGAVAHPVEVWTPGSALLDLSRLLELDLGNYGAVMVNTPHNPTGATASRAQIAELADRCGAAGTTLVVDEVSLGTLDPQASSVLRVVPGHPAVAQVGDVSKAFGLGGLRVGWCATPDPGLRRRMAALRDVTSLANAAPSQHLAALALEHRERLDTAASARANLECLAEAIDATAGWTWVAPTDGLVAFPRFPFRVSARVFAERLRHRFGVAVTPGSFFGHDSHLRVGLGLASELFAEAVDRLGDALAGEAMQA